MRPVASSKKLVLSVIVLILASVIALYAATGVVVSFQPQGATSTYAYGINVNGTVAGYWMDSASVWHGYLRDASSALTIIDEPDAETGANQGTFLSAVNDLGQTTGGYSCSLAPAVQCGFVRDQFGTFTSFVVPGAAATAGSVINNSGVIAGG